MFFSEQILLVGPPLHTADAQCLYLPQASSVRCPDTTSRRYHHTLHIILYCCIAGFRAYFASFFSYVPGYFLVVYFLE